MKKSFVFVLILGFVSCRPPTSLSDYECMETVVEFVQDGDTVDLVSGDRLRYAGINAPELGEEGSFEALELNEKLVKDKKCYVFILPEKDKYNRLIGHIYVKINGEYVNVNLLLLEEGVVTKYFGYLLKDIPEVLTSSQIKKLGGN